MIHRRSADRGPVVRRREHEGPPPYYSKLLGPVSFLRAVEKTDATVVWLNNGPIPADRERLMDDVGEKVLLPGVPMRRSYWAALQYATSGRWPDDDVVCFVEDDYLHGHERSSARPRPREGDRRTTVVVVRVPTSAEPFASLRPRHSTGRCRSRCPEPTLTS